MKKRKPEWVWLVEVDGMPSAVFRSFRAASAYLRYRRHEEPSIVITTTKIQSFLMDDRDA